MDLSYQEKSIWGSLGIVVLAALYYFVSAFRLTDGGTSIDAGAMARLSISVIVAIIVVEIAYHIAISIRSTPDSEDERDRLIAARATMIPSMVLAGGVFLGIGHIVWTQLLTASGTAGGWFTPFVTVHLLLASVVIAQITQFVTQLVHYRAGVR